MRHVLTQHPILPALFATVLLAGASPAWGGPADPSGGVSGDRPQSSGAATRTAGLEAAVSSRRVLLAGPRPQTLTFTLPGEGTAAVVVELHRTGSVSPVARWDLLAVPRGVAQSLTWDGGVEDGRGAKDGRHRFRLGVDGEEPVPIAQPFDFFRAFFPVRGPHSYGDGIGAGRGHQGQDVLAPCGTPLLAARGGVVEKAGFDGAAGNMVVIDLVGTPSDMVYMHLDDTPDVRAGDVVHTGQRIGDVGTTGRSTACHLHLELWSGPGYQAGGRPVDPARQLKLWDEQTGGNRAQGTARR